MSGMSVERFHAAECGLRPIEGSEIPEDVNIQCVQSSEFVLGKQNNFNGPVTIINCAEKQDKAVAEDQKNQMNEEKIVIRDKVLSNPTSAGEGNKKSDETLEEKKEKWWKRKWWKKLTKRQKIALLVCFGVLVVVHNALGVFVGIKFRNTTEEPLRIGKHLLYQKKAWGGKPSTLTVRMKLPVPYVVVSHTVTTLCHNLKGCSPRLRNMQDYHFQLEFSDISYNFLIDSGGNIYEGRGWSKKNAMGNFVYGRSINVGLIGDYSQGNNIPAPPLLDALKGLIEYGVENEKVSKNYSLLAASSVHSTLSPGINVYEVIKDWPHFDPDPKSHIKEYEV